MVCNLERKLAPATEGDVNMKTKISSTENLGLFTWGYEDGFLFPIKSKEFVLEAAGNNNGPFELRRRTGKANQKWRILYEYTDEDAEFRTAFALGTHNKRRSHMTSIDGKRTNKFTWTKNMVGALNDSQVMSFRESIDNIEWRRPEDIVTDGSKPLFVKDGMSRFDINQGQLGDCWALSVMANLAFAAKHKPAILERIFSSSQSFDNGNHTFTFNFFRDRKWHEVTVDDYLPCDSSGRLKFCSSKRIAKDKTTIYENEFWPCLLE